ncbi:MAG: zinc ribbon domain-containing protein [Candidatus Cloacimonetes bacterium]|nr:zinc ribbon domain-containing protein [Candidatus Cloacimonadota bacterium]
MDKELISYVCPKCGNDTYIKDEMRATGSYLAKLVDVQNKKFITISCQRCGYTEFYKKQSHLLGDIFDFLID